jgi:hypothetical protein
MLMALSRCSGLLSEGVTSWDGTGQYCHWRIIPILDKRNVTEIWLRFQPVDSSSTNCLKLTKWHSAQCKFTWQHKHALTARAVVVVLETWHTATQHGASAVAAGHVIATRAANRATSAGNHAWWDRTNFNRMWPMKYSLSLLVICIGWKKSQNKNKIIMTESHKLRIESSNYAKLVVTKRWS